MTISTIPDIRPPGRDRVAFAAWIALTTIATTLAVATIDPGLLGIDRANGTVTSNIIDRANPN